MWWNLRFCLAQHCSLSCLVGLRCVCYLLVSHLVYPLAIRPAVVIVSCLCPHIPYFMNPCPYSRLICSFRNPLGVPADAAPGLARSHTGWWAVQLGWEHLVWFEKDHCEHSFSLVGNGTSFFASESHFVWTGIFRQLCNLQEYFQKFMEMKWKGKPKIFQMYSPSPNFGIHAQEEFIKYTYDREMMHRFQNIFALEETYLVKIF